MVLCNIRISNNYMRYFRSLWYNYNFLDMSAAAIFCIGYLLGVVSVLALVAFILSKVK
jgi:uncharacterized membrane protein required for colicin V production